jgi:GNAT superfamily N-acetyltransferase
MADGPFISRAQGASPVTQIAGSAMPHERDQETCAAVTIRPFEERDASRVRELFIIVNRLLSPPNMREVFESYIARSLAEEIDRIPAYYGERGGGFWVAIRDQRIVGMFGLERAGPESLELRRMYVDPSARRRGIAASMLRHAEDECRRLAIDKIELSTSELQSAAVALYMQAGYQLVKEEVALDATNKTIGRGIRRYYFEKGL